MSQRVRMIEKVGAKDLVIVLRILQKNNWP